MAGSSMTFTYDRTGPIVTVIADWVSDDTTGAVTGTTANKVVGKIVKGLTNPGAAAPTANYDIVLTNAEALNVLARCEDNLLNRHTTTTEERYFLLLDTAGTPLAQSLHPVECSLITVAITNAGNSKNGRLILYVEGSLQGTE